MSQLPEIFNQALGQKSNPEQIKQAFNSIRDLLNNGIDADNIKNGAVGDVKIGERTINDGTQLTDAGSLTALLGALANAIKMLKGTANWKDPAATSLQYLLDNKSDKGHTHGGSIDGHTHYEFATLDILGVSRQIITNMLVARDNQDNVTDISYTTSEGESGSVNFHRDSLGRLDCERLSNSLGTQVQIEMIRDERGKLTRIYRSAFNRFLQSGLEWPIV